MKPIARALTIAAILASFVRCGGGTLGGGGGNNGGVPTPIPTGAGAFDGGGAVGFGGDIAPPGGRGGAGGVGPGGSFGGEFGTGGTWGPPLVCQPVPPVCGSLCGNGKIDQCPGPVIPGCPVIDYSEECDGSDFGSGSCELDGWGSGKLTCNSDCTVTQANGCSPCAPPDSLVASCGPVPVLVSSSYLAAAALAATDTEIGVAVLAYDASARGQSLMFGRLAPDLSVLATTSFAASESSLYELALAPLPAGGWAIALCGERGLFVQTVSAAGLEAGRVSVPGAASSDGYCTVPLLAARPGGGPLLLWRTESGVSMALVADDGLSVSPPRPIVDEIALGWNGVAAAWVGDEFAVAVPIHLEGTFGAEALRRLGVRPDGSVRLLGDDPFVEVDGVLKIATGPDARDVRIVYRGVAPGDFGGDHGLIWLRPDGTGPGRSAKIALPFGYSGPGSAVAFGDDTVVLADSVGGDRDGIGVVRVASDGRVVSPFRDVALTPSGYIRPLDMVRRGPEIVIGFFGPAGLYLERLTP